MTHKTVDLLGLLPVIPMFAAQATGNDAVWLVTNLAFLLYHLLFTKLWTLAACSTILTAISVARILHKRPKAPSNGSGIPGCTCCGCADGCDDRCAALRSSCRVHGRCEHCGR